MKLRFPIGMRPGALLPLAILIALMPLRVYGQSCTILNKGNNMIRDRLCSPIDVNWEVFYVGVNNAGTTVQIHYDWDDGSSETITATEGPAGTFTAIANHTYTSKDDRCNYHPVATLVVNGVMCQSSSQEQIITVWDNDDTNGGRVDAQPDVYPVCVGNGATMRFADDTRFNCVPPQERDDPNEDTRWIQWVYGTANSMSSASPVLVNGVAHVYPFEGPVITLPGPVHGSDEVSLPITVANDNQIGDEFQVELRYWNYCNPYPGSDPVIDRSVIRIVGNPDATITPVDTMCEYNNPINLQGADGGGTWSGDGITNTFTGEFTPPVAGAGIHEIIYQITDGNGCFDSDTTTIAIRPAPVASITPIDPLCIYDPPYDLESVPEEGTWSGDGITNSTTGLFDPAVAGAGGHTITFTTETDPYGCFGVTTEVIRVADLPFAEILTADSAWCVAADNRTTAEILITGSDTSSFDLILQSRGVVDTLFNLSAGTQIVDLDNQTGRNEYILQGIIEHHGSRSCDADLNDTLVVEVHPLPDMSVSAIQDEWCSPVDVAFYAVPGYNRYFWMFGDDDSTMTRTSSLMHTYVIPEEDSMIMVIDTIDQIIDTSYYAYVRMDTAFQYEVIIETEFGCRDTTGHSVQLFQTPEASFFVSPQIQHYPETGFYLLNSSTYGEWTYEWDFGDGETSAVRNPEGHQYGTYGFYDIELKVSNTYCRDSITKQVQILPPAPVAMFEPDTIGCPPLKVTFENASEYADSYIWDFDDGQFSTEKNPTHTFYQSKVHHEKLTANGLSGIDTIQQAIYIHGTPTAVFNVYPTNARNLTQVFKFVNNSADASYYLWDFGDGVTSAEEDATHIYGEAGTFTVILYAWSENGCPDTLIKESLIHVIAGEGNTEFPNVFIWNGSGPSGGHWTEGTIDNTVFHPNMENVAELKMIIYTRWGEKVFETNEVHVGWDGYLNSGELATQGVYVYKAWVTYVSGEQDLLTGDVTFLH
jgi:PKD repeat protein